MPDQPYADAAPVYWHAGWRGVLPLPTGQKKHPPRGYTGAQGDWPSYPDLEAWREETPTGNLALRLPPGVIGIDVDNYGDKHGLDTMIAASEKWGMLVDTWRSSARDDGISGIMLFRVPEGLHWPGEVPGGHVEIIQTRHRYLVAWPSTNPDADGAPYRWYTPDDVVAVGNHVPQVDELPWLPDTWIDGLTSGRQPEASHTKVDAADDQVRAWSTGLRLGPPCRRMTDVITTARLELAGAGSRHDAMNRAVGRIIRAADGGHCGLGEALDQVSAAFESAVGKGGSGQRDGDTARGEFSRGLRGAIGLVLADTDQPPRPDLDPCDNPFAGLLPPGHPPPPLPLPTTSVPSSTPPPTAAAAEPAAVFHAPEPPAEVLARAAAAPERPASTDRGDHATRADLDALIAPRTTPAGPAGPPAPTATTSAPAPAAEPARTAPAATDDALSLIPGTTTPPSTDTTTGADQDPSDAETRAAYRAQLADVETERLRARRTAQRALDDEQHAASFRVPPFRATLVDELAIPDEPITYTVDQLLPTGGNVLLAAQYKAGKTTTMLNLIRSLADRDPFLGEYAITTAQPGRVAWWNYEVDPAQARRWLRETGIERPEHVSTLNLRGYRVPLTVPRVEDWVVRWLEEHEVAVWIVDPFARAAVGSVNNENDNTEVGAFLDTLDVIKERAGVRDLIMPTHTGRGEMEEGQERARGATRLDDWADVRWLLTRDEHDTRYFRATGRDVDTKESALYYRELTRELVLNGGSRAQTRTGRADTAVVAVLEDKPGAGVRELRALVRDRLGKIGNAEIDEAVERLEAQGRVRVEEGRGRLPKRHFLASVAMVAGDS